MVSCILLAAGSSSRFGSNKLQHSLPTGKTVFQSSLSIYLPLVSDLLVVVRPDDTLLQKQLNAESVSYLECAESINGMSQSLVSGVRSRSDASGWLIALADMPYVQPGTVKHILQLAGARSIVQPTYDSIPGNPVYFGREYYSELIQLTGDKGGKEVIQRHHEKLIRFDYETIDEMFDNHIPTDIAD